MSYIIYHIPGVKIGCTTNVKRRVNKQGYFEYQILEIHNDIYEVSKREMELQKEYGYKVDKLPYYVAYNNRLKNATKESRAKGAKVPHENKSHKGEKNTKAKLTNVDVLKIIEMTNSGLYLQKDIAKIYNVDRQTIRRITQKKMWKHISDN